MKKHLFALSIILTITNITYSISQSVKHALYGLGYSATAAASLFIGYRSVKSLTFDSLKASLGIKPNETDGPNVIAIKERQGRTDIAVTSLCAYSAYTCIKNAIDNFRKVASYKNEKFSTANKPE